MKGIFKFESVKERKAFKKKFTCLCPQCKTLTDYDEKYDAYFCSDCNIWAESKCKDKDCRFCKSRPDKPIENS